MSDRIDVAIGRLLDDWRPRIGDPTCRAGCANCCKRTTILISSAEALEIIDKGGEAVERARPRIIERVNGIMAAPLSSPQDGIDALIDQGPCAFLEDNRCSIYDVRPDACRACLVWHHEWYCGHLEYDMVTPVELMELRIREIHHKMLAEFDAGRWPFMGQLAPTVGFMGRYRDGYVAGESLTGEATDQWHDLELLMFPSRETLEEDLAGLEASFREQPHPLAMPSGAEARRRDDLAPFKIN